jgi:heptosyltransferase II
LSDHQNIKNILIIKPGAIGDVLHLTPVIRALKGKYPHARITFMLGSRVTASLLENNPFVHETILFDKRGEHRSFSALITLWRRIRQGNFDLVVNFQRSNLKAWFLITAAFPCRVLVYHKAKNRVVHAVVNHLETLAPLGIDPAVVDQRLDFFPSPADEEFVDTFIRTASLEGKRIVAFNPGTNHLCKCWPVERFAVLGDLLVERFGVAVVILGSHAESHLAETIIGGMRHHAHDLTGCSLGQSGALFKRTELLVTGDTGPMHIASAVGTRVLALFGPISPQRSGPFGPGHRVILHNELDCCPCNSFTCKNIVFRRCMEEITVEEVFSAASEMCGTVEASAAEISG